MIRRCALWSTLALVATLVACAPQETADVAEEGYAEAEMMDMAAIAEGMDALEAAFVAAYDAGDAAGVAALFAEDAMQSPALSPALDRAGIEAMYTAQFADELSWALTVQREDYVASGDMVVAWGTFEVTATPEGADPIMANGRYGTVVKKQADGSWKIYRHMFNWETPPPGFGM